jgi:adenosylcobyric acid synthase
VGDIDRGGVFAQLLGTLLLLEPAERDRIKGLIINKFRGDKTILDSGIDMLEQKGQTPVVGLVPYMELHLEDEDSLSPRLQRKQGDGKIDIAVIRYPRISNFTDFNTFEQSQEVSLRYVTEADRLGHPDLILLPGSKNTMEDLAWLRERGFAQAILAAVGQGCTIWGVCGGYQMLGETIQDPLGVEAGGSIRGLGLLPMDTILEQQKTRRQVQGKLPELGGIFQRLSGLDFVGYEIHMGQSALRETQQEDTLPVVMQTGNIYGSYVHGIFDKKEIAVTLLQALAENKGQTFEIENWQDYSDVKEAEYDKLAAVLREHLDMDAIYGMLGEN